jgi:hypothetical protein
VKDSDIQPADDNKDSEGKDGEHRRATAYGYDKKQKEAITAALHIARARV